MNKKITAFELMGLISLSGYNVKYITCDNISIKAHKEKPNYGIISGCEWYSSGMKELIIDSCSKIKEWENSTFDSVIKMIISSDDAIFNQQKNISLMLSEIEFYEIFPNIGKKCHKIMIRGEDQKIGKTIIRNNIYVCSNCRTENNKKSKVCKKCKLKFY